MRESRDKYIMRRMREDRMKEPSMTEIDIYKKNIADLQEQLQNSYIKQKLFKIKIKLFHFHCKSDCISFL